MLNLSLITIFGISFISEVELLGHKNITIAEEQKLKQLLSDCFQIEWSLKLKEQTIKLKRQYPIKLPDAIIAATCLIFEIPLITADKGFSRIKELDLVLIEV